MPVLAGDHRGGDAIEPSAERDAAPFVVGQRLQGGEKRFGGHVLSLHRVAGMAMRKAVDGRVIQMIEIGEGVGVRLRCGDEGRLAARSGRGRAGAIRSGSGANTGRAGDRKRGLEYGTCDHWSSPWPPHTRRRAFMVWWRPVAKPQ